MGIADILRRSGGDLFQSTQPWGEEKRQRLDDIINIANIANTWGAPIPFTIGNIRVAGYQIWASQFYNLQTTIERTGIEYLPAEGGGGVASGERLKPRTRVDAMTETAIDIAYSFGVNAVPGTKRILTKLRIDGQIVYDLEKGIAPETGFNLYYGDGEVQDPIIFEALKEKTPYYKDKIYIVFSGMVFYTRTRLPTSVDAEFRTEVISGNSAVVSTFETIEPGPVLPDFKRRIFYVYRRTPGYGSFEKYDMDTYQKLSTAVITTLSETKQSDGYDVPDPLYGPGIRWFPNSRVAFGQQDYFGGRVRVRAIDPETGTELGANGFNEQNFGSRDNSEVGGMVRWSEFEAKGFTDYTNGGDFYAGARAGNGRIYLYTFNGSAAVGSVNINRIVRENVYPGRYTVKGDGFVYCANLNTKKISKFYPDGTMVAFADAPGNPSLGNLVYYGGTLVSIDNNGIRAFDSTGKEIYKHEVVLPGVSNLDDPNYISNSNLSDGTFAWISGLTDLADLKLTVINLPTGVITQYNLTNQPNNPRASFWDATSARAIVLNTITNSFQVQAPTKRFGGTVLLRDFIRACYVATGFYTPDQITFEGIDDTIIGAGLFVPTGLGSIINDICRLYRIDKLDGETSVKFFRNRVLNNITDVTADLDISELALISENEGDGGVALKTIISSSAAQKAQIDLTFLDINNEFKPNSVTWRRPDAAADQNDSVKLSIPIVMTKNEAALLIQQVFADKTAADTMQEFRLPKSLNYLGKSDIIRIKHGDKRQFSDIVRITQETLNKDYSISCIGENMLLGQSEPTIIVDVPTGTVGGQSSEPTSAFIFDIPALRRQDNPVSPDDFLQYTLLYGIDPWKDGYLARSINSGDFGFLYSSVLVPNMLVARCNNALANKYWMTDNEPLIISTVIGSWDAEDNATAAELYASEAKNLALYGSPGRWEIVQFRSIVDGVVTGVLRGLRGTEIHAGSHQPNDYFITVTQSLVGELRAYTSVGIAERYKASAPMLNFTASPVIDHTPTGASLRPWAPWDVRGTKASPEGTLALSWRRRDRLAGGLDTGGAVMSEDRERYEVVIFASDGTEKRVISSTTTSAQYTLAQQTQDGLQNETELTIAVYQLSAFVGRGFGRKVTINV